MAYGLLLRQPSGSVSDSTEEKAPMRCIPIMLRDSGGVSQDPISTPELDDLFWPFCYLYGLPFALAPLLVEYTAQRWTRIHRR